MKCPKCGGSLVRQAYSQHISVVRCQSCHGMLLDPGMLEQIRVAVRADEFFDIGHPKVGKALDRVREYACPACGGAMHGSRDPAQHHVFMERCSGCGSVFLDAGELLDLSHDTVLERLWGMVSRMTGNG